MLIYDRDVPATVRTAEALRARFRVPITTVAWQELDDVGELGLSEPEATATLHWVDAYGNIDRGSRAVGRALTMGSGAPVVLGWALLTTPFSWVVAPAYRCVAAIGGRVRPSR